MGITWKRGDSSKSLVGMEHIEHGLRKRASFPGEENLRTSLRPEDLNTGFPRKRLRKYVRPQWPSWSGTASRKVGGN